MRMETGGWKRNRPNRRILRTKEVSTNGYVEVKCDQLSSISYYIQ